MSNEWLEQMFSTLVRGGMTPDEATMNLCLSNQNKVEVEAVRAAFFQKNRRWIELRDPQMLIDLPRHESWYAGPDFSGAWCWPPYKKRVSAKMSPEDFEKLDRASTKILAHMPQPARARFNHRGMVVGYVQSGKTANYAGLIAKAADVGYRMFIILAGTTSKLRRQTHIRLMNDVCHQRQRWHALTSDELDFQPGTMLADNLLASADQRCIAVIKKNSRILDRVIDFLRRANRDLLAQTPVLIIDDEADNASVNTSKKKRTAINTRILEITRLLDRVAYVGYTATPFANIFIDPRNEEDLFPRHFIVSLERPDAYFGAEKIFGRELLAHDPEDAVFEGLDMIREIRTDPPHNEEDLLRPKGRDIAAFEPRMTESLDEAIRYFILATACREVRGQGNEHSSMLIHTTQYVAAHARLQAMVEEHLEYLRANWRSEIRALEALWDRELNAVSGVGPASVPFAALEPRVAGVLEACRVVVDNGQIQDEGLVFRDDVRQVCIAIGGNTLSRGLTLEGLIVSYFIRTASAYDTLLQMGRWFGYRKGYEDLPRIWLTRELDENFQFLALVEEEIRRDIARMEKEGKTPKELAIRVRTHPKLSITLKRGAESVISASYSDRQLQTFLFNGDDERWLRANLDATRWFVERLKAGASVDQISDGTWRFVDVGADEVLAFLRRYLFHPDHDELRPSLLENYIKRERDLGSLERWNVVVLGRDSRLDELGDVDLGLGPGVPCINRSRFRTTRPHNIKALISHPDRVADLDLDSVPSGDLAPIRNLHAPTTGLLTIYPISMHSAPDKGEPGDCPTCGMRHRIQSKMRHPLKAAEHVIGLGLFFPRSRVADESVYMGLDLEALFGGDGSDEGEDSEESMEKDLER